MHNAKLEIVLRGDGLMELSDISVSDENIGNREVFITDGYGEQYYVKFNMISNTEFFEMPRKDMAYKVLFKTTPVDTPQEGSVYEITDYVVSSIYSDSYLLKLLDSLHCSSGCTPDLKGQSQAFEIINNIEGARRYADKCELYRAQRLLDYLAEYYCNSQTSINCCVCGKEY